MERTTAMALRQCSRIRIARACISASRSQAITSSIQGQRKLSQLSQSTNLRTPPRHTHSSFTTRHPQYSTSTSSSTQPSTLSRPTHLNAKEAEIWTLLNDSLDCISLDVQDISGGCGSMYGIDVVSERFRGLSMLKQQRLVNGILGEEIKTWHGVQLKTRAP